MPTSSVFETACKSNLRASASRFGGKNDHIILYFLAME
jgi:hypothetical protein